MEIKQIGKEHTFLGFRLVAFVEIFLFFLIATIIAIILKIPFNYFALSLHPFWIVIILISAQYGIREGLFTTLLAILLYITGPLPSPTVLQDDFDYFFSIIKLPLMWLVAAVVLGELRSKHIIERNALRDLALEAKEKEKSITDSYLALKKLKENLEVRVATEMQTALMAYAAFRKFEEEGNIIKGAEELVKTLIDPQKFSLFLLEENQLKCVFTYGWTSLDKYLKSFDKETELFQEMQAMRVVSVINVEDLPILEKEGLLAVPILSIHRDPPVLGMIKIEDMPFAKLKMRTIESLREIGEWVGGAYAHYINQKR